MSKINYIKIPKIQKLPKNPNELRSRSVTQTRYPLKYASHISTSTKQTHHPSRLR